MSAREWTSNSSDGCACAYINQNWYCLLCLYISITINYVRVEIRLICSTSPAFIGWVWANFPLLLFNTAIRDIVNNLNRFFKNNCIIVLYHILVYLLTVLQLYVFAWVAKNYILHIWVEIKSICFAFTYRF